jgi:hypothetical protein
MRGKVKTSVVVATLLLIVIGFVFRDTLARFILLRIADKATGTTIAVRSMHITAQQAILEGITVRSSLGEPIADIKRIVAMYDLHEALPGGKRFLGLSSIDIVRPRVTLLRRADGTFAFPLPPSNGAVNSAP